MSKRSKGVFFIHWRRMFLGIILLISLVQSGWSQVGAEIEVEKPKKYENRRLRAEKTGEKKLTLPKRLYQNTVTHYNYYFNANQRLNDLVETAKQGFKEDYAQLLPFYNYTLEATAQNKTELDSIIYKCTAGILLHDLRNDWIDNMYLLMAKAYLFRNDLDSANMALQYINFAFAPKEAGGYDIPIGSNASNDKGEFTISTKEKNNVFKKVFTRPPSRNESFIWQIRTYIERNELGEAAGIIEILRTDPNFPKRLHNSLNEVTAYWLYKQKLYDSSAHYLVKALDNANGGHEKARWEYLAAQMFQLSNNKDLAAKYYQKAMDHTIDPVMDVYARLNALKLQKSTGKDYLQENIDALLAMARKDKYENYRDIIYYAAATLELERKSYANAEKDLLKSVQFTSNNPSQRSQAFLLLGDMNYDQKAFAQSYNFYDSLDVKNLADSNDAARVELRKTHLKTIVGNLQTVKEQDSLQVLAKMSPEEREAFIKKQQKKNSTDKDAKSNDAGNVNVAVKQPLPDLFSGNDKDKGNDFYFYNNSAKSKGFGEFKTRWGTRPNVDNWRRQSAIDKMTVRFGDVDDAGVEKGDDDTGDKKDGDSVQLSGIIPVTPEELQTSNKAVKDALYQNGMTFLNKLENYPAAIDAFEELLKRFPDSEYTDEVLFNLAYALQKTGDKAKAEQYRQQLLASKNNNKWSRLAKNPKLADSAKIDPAITHKYEEIYNMFIEGRFEEAKNEKRIADSLYDKSYWTPQLLFIEAIYYIKIQDDSTAITVLGNLVNLYGDNPMADRARTMIDVLRRRKEIEEYLTKLEVTRKEDGTVVIKENTPAPIVRSNKEIKTTVPPPEKKTETPEDKKTESTNDKKDETVKDEKQDKDVQPPVQEQPENNDTTMMDQPEDTSTVAPGISVKDFNYTPTDPHFVVILLDKVDPVYASEAKNAFNRYNREKFYAQQINITNEKLDDRFNLILQGPFDNATAAVEYIDKIRPFTPSRILPWLSAEKYSYMIINEDNLDILKQTKDMDAYKQLLQLALPGKF